MDDAKQASQYTVVSLEPFAGIKMLQLISQILNSIDVARDKYFKKLPEAEQTLMHQANTLYDSAYAMYAVVKEKLDMAIINNAEAAAKVVADIVRKEDPYAVCRLAVPQKFPCALTQYAVAKTEGMTVLVFNFTTFTHTQQSEVSFDIIKELAVGHVKESFPVLSDIVVKMEIDNARHEKQKLALP